MQGGYRHTIWIAAANEETILTSFVDLARLFMPALVKEETNQRTIVTTLLRWLEQCPQPWLLIFDNADDLDLVQPYLPHQALEMNQQIKRITHPLTMTIRQHLAALLVRLDRTEQAQPGSTDLPRAGTPTRKRKRATEQRTVAISSGNNHTLPACPRCQQTTAVLKSGKNRSGSQRFHCRACQLYFTPNPGVRQPDQAHKAEALTLARQGMSCRRIARQLGVHHQTVSAWISTSGESGAK